MSSSSKGKRPLSAGSIEEPEFPCAKRRPAQGVASNFEQDGGRLTTSLCHGDYTVGWVCALAIELAAARAMLDKYHGKHRSELDHNIYTLGSIAGLNVVMTCLPENGIGSNSAASVAADMRRSFPSIRIRLMVGIGGGVPGYNSMRLGDVVVGNIVKQYDFGKTIGDGSFQRSEKNFEPPPAITAALSALRADHERVQSQIPSIISSIFEADTSMSAYKSPGSEQDILFKTDYTHANPFKSCEECDRSREVKRVFRTDRPRIFYAGIASGNQVIKHGEKRDHLARELGVVCFEMEAAGLMHQFPCLVIRGISDYSDSHKNKQWQRYAAVTAAAYTKELLCSLPESANSSQALECRTELLESLKFDEIDARRVTIKDAQKGTCGWLLQHAAYQDWLDPGNFYNHHGFLWISGKPGVGKSTTMKFAWKNAALGDSAVISFFFNARGHDLEKTTVGMYRSLLSQLMTKFSDLQDLLDRRDIYTEGTGPREWRIEGLQETFADAVDRLGQRSLKVFVDALDECQREQVQDMVDFFEEIGERASKSSTKLFTCFSSRHYPHVHIRYGRKLVLENQQGHGEDLEKYVKSKLRIGNDKLAQEIWDDVLNKAAGVFLWVVLVVRILNEELGNGRIFAVKKRLREVPSELSDLFKDILKRDSRNLADLLLCLQWILFAKNPLKPEEFYFAMAAGLEPEPVSLEWDKDSITADSMHRFVVSSSKGLAEVTKTKSKTVQFIHESVRDYLVKENGLRELWTELGSDFENMSHDKLKVCCDNYLKVIMSAHIDLEKPLQKASSGAAKRSREEFSKRFPLVEYATHHVLYHANKAATETSQREFLDSFPLAGWLKINNILEKFQVRRYTAAASLSYICAEKDLAHIIREMLTQSPTMEIWGERHRYPIFAALDRKNRDTVNAILHDELKDQTDLLLGDWEKRRPKKGETPMFWSIRNGRTAVVRLLLDKGATPNAQGGHYGNALQAALGYGHEPIVRLLLEKGADVNAQGGHYGNALQAASRHGHEPIVRLLLEKGADVNAQGGFFGNALQAALGYGHEPIVRLLLEKGADVNAQSGFFGNALQAALGYGHEPIVRLLLEKGADVNAQDGLFDNTLQAASDKGYELIVRLLLEKGADVNAQGGYYGNALYAASDKGYEPIVRLLLEKGADVNAQGGEYGNALQAALARGHELIVRLLLEKGADVNAQGGLFDNALQAASYKGYEPIVRLLLEKGADVNAQGGYYGNALQVALAGGYELIVRLLLEKGADVNAQGGEYGNALQAASRHGHEPIVRLLREKSSASCS